MSFGVEYQLVGVCKIEIVFVKAARTVGPGPAGYKVPGLIGNNRTNVWKDRAPDFSFGRRLDRKADTPGPGPFTLPESIGKNRKNIYPNRQPEYSM